ncbi:hypothetical protein [Streptomyces sp. NPDC058304]|uniref:hypothetical protein n=1 Tax=Streptomyces sp. NPDC058304 TaxID=3346437 RepID=UPI0036EDF4F6
MATHAPAWPRAPSNLALEAPVYAIGMCVDARYLLPALVTLGSVADHLSVADRRESAVRVLTNCL